MRPTDLQFRSPKEKTPDAYFPNMTHDGNKLTFPHPKFSKIEQKPTSLPKGDRFPQYKQWAQITCPGVGPGVYNQQENFIRMKSKPCSAVYVHSTMGKEVGKSCYLQVGDSIMFEPAFLTGTEKKAQNNLEVPDCRVHTAMTQTRSSSIRFRSTHTGGSPWSSNGFNRSHYGGHRKGWSSSNVGSHLHTFDEQERQTYDHSNRDATDLAGNGMHFGRRGQSSSPVKKPITAVPELHATANFSSKHAGFTPGNRFSNTYNEKQSKSPEKKQMNTSYDIQEEWKHKKKNRKESNNSVHFMSSPFNDGGKKASPKTSGNGFSDFAIRATGNNQQRKADNPESPEAEKRIFKPISQKGSAGKEGLLAL